MCIANLQDSIGSEQDRTESFIVQQLSSTSSINVFAVVMASSSAGALRQRKMIRQMREHDQREAAEMAQIAFHTNEAADGLVRKHCQVMAGLVVLGILFVLYYQPKFLFKRKGERLASRTILTLFPTDIDIQASLPRFFQSYGVYK